MDNMATATTHPPPPGRDEDEDDPAVVSIDRMTADSNSDNDNGAHSDIAHWQTRVLPVVMILVVMCLVTAIVSVVDLARLLSSLSVMSWLSSDDLLSIGCLTVDASQPSPLVAVNFQLHASSMSRVIPQALIFRCPAKTTKNNQSAAMKMLSPGVNHTRTAP